MSINHISSDLPETLWWRQHQQQEFMMNEPTPNTSNSSKHNSLFTPHQNHHHHHRNNHHQLWLLQNQNQNPTLNNLNLNQLDNEDEPEEQITDELITDITKEEEHHQLLQKEFMFEKPLTPSDVGKLNRLVIPKQHAEKYFPLGGGSTGGDSGLLLSFEDELGKCWRFRYSYWNSSQSYVLTKGWSRFVKEKRLDAGDVVFFERHRTELDRFFIGWRRRESAVAAQSGGCGDDNSGGGGSGWTRVFYSAHPYPSHPLPYQPNHCLHADAGSIGQNQTTPVGNSKRLRLFGVNLECQLDESSEPPTPHGSSLSSLAQAPYEYYTESHGATHPNYMQDMNLSGDVNQMINRRG